MKWILIVGFFSMNLLAASTLSELLADVQKDITSTEESQAVLTTAGASTTVAAAKVDVTTQEEKTTPLVDKATAKETEIPLSLEAQKKATTSESPYFRIIMVVALLGILACGTWIFVRKNKFQNIRRNKNEIKVLAQHYLGPKKSLAVIRVAGESILVGITDSHINMIKTLSLMDDELPDVTSDNFKSELDERMIDEPAKQAPSATYNRKSQINTKPAVNDEEADEFSIRGIKDLVSSKLKNMRSI